MPMTPEVLVPLGFVLLVGVLLVYTQVISPWRLRGRLARGFASRGWTSVVPEREPGWRAIMNLAVGETQGAVRTREYEEKAGPVTMQVKTSETRSGSAKEVYRDMGTWQHRYAGVATMVKKVDSRSGPVWLGGRERRGSVGRDLLIGEARRIPVEAPELVYSAFSAMFGEAGRRMAESRGVDPEIFPELASESRGEPARTIRELLEQDGLALKLMAKAHVGPESWVIAMPLGRAGAKLEDIISLAERISVVIDRVSR